MKSLPISEEFSRRWSSIDDIHSSNGIDSKTSVSRAASSSRLTIMARPRRCAVLLAGLCTVGFLQMATMFPTLNVVWDTRQGEDSSYEPSAVTWLGHVESASYMERSDNGVTISDNGNAAMTLAQSVFYKPRILIGIISDSQTETAMEMRKRQRQIFKHWQHDPRLCSLQEFLSKNGNSTNSDQYMTSKKKLEIEANNDYDCHVVYTFVLGAYSKTTSTSFVAQSTNGVPTQRNLSTLRLHDTQDQPLVVDHTYMATVSKSGNATESPPYQDVLDNNDGVFLNIIENMNHGKTPTFMNWASQLSQQHGIPYIAKCDSDVFLRMDKMFELVRYELPPIPVLESITNMDKPPSVMASEIIHRREKKLSTLDMSYWTKLFYMGQNLYVQGGFYLMSNNLALEATREARYFEHIIPDIMNWEDSQSANVAPNNDPHGYLEGVEDHDATAMIHFGHYRSLLSPRQRNETDFLTPSVIQWITMPRELYPFVHPVKEAEKWNELVAKELNTTSNGSAPIRVKTVTNQEKRTILTLIVIYSAGDITSRQLYRRKVLEKQGLDRCCGALEANETLCNTDVQYLFVVGRGRTGRKSPNVVHNQQTLARLLHSANITFSSKENDVIFVDDADDNDHLALTMVALSYVHNHGSFGAVIFCKSSTSVSLEGWRHNILASAKYSLQLDRHLLIGDVRERNKKGTMDFRPRRRNPKYRRFFRPKYKSTHLYLGSDCFAISANLIPILWNSVFEPKVELFLDGTGHLGHDLMYLALAADSIKLHWMRVPKGMHFWSPLS